ncbi:MAG TPA: glycerol kinase GlpK [Terriglobales bacterium]|nr:glycerol kinase GlpK [Terriglobales bacterium]
MPPRYFGAIDQGTTSTRFLIFDRAGGVVACAQREHRQFYPQPGWVEHDPEEIWRNTQAVIAEALRGAGLSGGDLRAIGIANQRETTLLWRRDTGEPVCPAIVWQDMRVEPMVADLAHGEAGLDRFRAQTGLPLATYFSALKLRWMLDHVPGARQAAAGGGLLFGTVDTFLLWRLTGGPAGGVHATDVTNASRTQLMSLRALAWDEGILAELAIPAALLPPIRSSAEVYGEAVVAPIQGVPIAGILGDQQAALVGQGCWQSGDAKNTYGTGCFLLLHTGSQPVASTHGLITTVAYRWGAQPAQYALEGSVAIAGALVQWLRDNLGLIGASAEIEDLARTVADNGGVYFVPAFSGLYAPYWKASARGVICGLTRAANRGHIARAALEAAAFQTCDVVEAMEQEASLALARLRVDGGMVENDLLMQFQADLLGRPVERAAMKETTALGAALAAAVGAGCTGDPQELGWTGAVGRQWLPAMAAGQRVALRRSWARAVSRSLGWID